MQQVRYSPNNVQGVVTYSAVVEVDNPEEKLRPGMTATVTIKTREVEGRAPRPERGAPLQADAADGRGRQADARRRPSRRSRRARAASTCSPTTSPATRRPSREIVDIGITDGINTEVTGRSLAAGTKVVTDETDQTTTKKRAPRFF